MKEETALRTQLITLALGSLLAGPVYANECESRAGATIKGLAFDALLEHDSLELSQAAIDDYRYVIDNGDRKKDADVIELACIRITRILDAAGELESRPELYADCPEVVVLTTMDARMPPIPDNADDSENYVPIVAMAPGYPKRAINKGVNGVVFLEFTIDAEGNVVDDRVVASTDKMFEKPARTSMRKWKFVPRTINGVPVAVPGVTRTVNFFLDYIPEAYPGQRECAITARD